MMDDPILTQPQAIYKATLQQDAYCDFLITREGMNCTPATMTFYEKNLGKIDNPTLINGRISHTELIYVACGTDGMNIRVSQAISNNLSLRRIDRL